MHSNTEITAVDRIVARQEQLLRELASDLADLVAAGEMTSEQANETLAAKQDYYFGGDR